MSKSRIKRGVSRRRPRGRRSQRVRQFVEREKVQRGLREQARRRRMTRIDEDTGEEYILSRLAAANKDDGKRLAKDLEAIRDAEDGDPLAVLQQWVDEKKLIPVACHPKDKPTCRAYKDGTVMVMTGDEE